MKFQKSVVNNKWYIGGLHFACQQCCRCCSGPEEGVIWISKPEINLLAEHLGLSISEFRKKYLKRIGLRYSIREEPRSKDCIFLTTKGCSIYKFRPMQCRSWPFWPENLQSPDDWNTAAKKCPGINKGRLYCYDEIEKIKNQKQWWEADFKSQISNLRSLCDEIKEIYDWLDTEIKQFNTECSACGKCCNFDSFGHKLFITSPELIYFQQNAEKLKPAPDGHCPYLVNNKCTARDFRFAGCRIFFCRADKDLQNELSEKTVAKFRTICDKYDIPYYYRDLTAVL